ncbi:histone deacetylase [Rhizophagus irregularis]|uniref:Histone deacetylase n=1 Tax=Rhizophagus irregularis TaxID=588596 RepID=A0A2N0SAC8_9GLOM|nr:histone deacetylase [Rhizophagus irregularis]
MSSSSFLPSNKDKTVLTQPATFHIQPHSKQKVSYFHHKDVGNFHFGLQHPMKPHRLALTNNLVLSYGLHKKMTVYCPPKATDDELMEFHEVDYIKFLKKVTPENSEEFAIDFPRFNINADCPIFEGLYDFCQIYAGASIAAAHHLASDGADICINWSGGLHHAKRFYPRVLYIDIDIHHGDGVQEAFFATDRVMTVSFHKYDGSFFPGTGNTSEIGCGLDGIDDNSYVTLFKEVMLDVRDHYQPSVVVLQCGADSLGKDRLGGFNISIKAHGECVRFIKSWQVPLLVLGGGGYRIPNVARCWTYETGILLDTELQSELPQKTHYYNFFGPDFSLHPPLVRKIDDLNKRSDLKQIYQEVHELLRFLDGAPSVQMQELPGNLQSIFNGIDEEFRDVGFRGRKPLMWNENEYFDGDSDNDKW